MTTYPCLLADPPWSYDDKGTGKRGATGRHYDTMPLADIASLVPRLVDGGEFELPEEDAWLWLWTTNQFVVDGSAAFVAQSWGYRPVTAVTWIKTTRRQTRRGVALWGTPAPEVKLGVGRYVRNCTEQLVVCVRGMPKPLDMGVGTAFWASSGRHSAKPDESYRLIERVCDGPRLELFARRRLPGWDAWGDQCPKGE